MPGLGWSAGVFSDCATFFATTAPRIGVGRRPFYGENMEQSESDGSNAALDGRTRGSPPETPRPPRSLRNPGLHIYAKRCIPTTYRDHNGLKTFCRADS